MIGAQALLSSLRTSLWLLQEASLPMEQDTQDPHSLPETNRCNERRCRRCPKVQIDHPELLYHEEKEF